MLYKKIILFTFHFIILTYSFSENLNYQVGVEDTNNYPHYQYYNGQYIGFASEVLDKFISSQNCKYRDIPYRKYFKSKRNTNI